MTGKTVIVYLDTQDYSRFGDVARGRASIEVCRVLDELKALKAEGLVRFAYSMPILSELLQYDPDHEETTLAKAQVIEALCGDSALLWPSRLVEAQAASFGKSIGLPLSAEVLTCVRSGNEWFPRIAAELMDMKERWRAEVDAAAAHVGHLNRKQRRVVEAHKSGRKLIVAVKAASPAFAEKYGIPLRAVEESVLLFLKGKITAQEASHALFGAVAKPTAFVNAYFKINEGDKSLPGWIRGLGEGLERTLTEFRSKAQLLIRDQRDVDHLRAMLKRDSRNFGIAVLRMIDTEEAEQGVTAEILQTIVTDPRASAEIPVCRILGELVLGYLDQTVAALQSPAKIERSFAGDLIHSLYLDCVDVWRGDRRFSALVKQRLPSLGHKVQASLIELPAHIRSLARDQGDAILDN